MKNDKHNGEELNNAQTLSGCSASGNCCGSCQAETEDVCGCRGASSWKGHSCRTCICILGATAGIFLAVWTVAKSVEIERMLNYPPAGVSEHAITLSATGKTTASPDTAEIELSVLTEGRTPQEVQRENTGKMNAIVEFVKASKVDPKDVKTATYSLYPKYEYLKGQSNIAGYTLTQSLRIKLRDLAQVGAILEGATVRGANQVGDVRFIVDDPEKFKEEARKEAFGKVDAKAQEFSRLAGVKLGRVVSFSESGGDMPPPVYYGKAEAFGLGGAGAPPQIESGSQDITVTVTATYRIK